MTSVLQNTMLPAPIIAIRGMTTSSVVLARAHSGEEGALTDVALLPNCSMFSNTIAQSSTLKTLLLQFAFIGVHSRASPAPLHCESVDP